MFFLYQGHLVENFSQLPPLGMRAIFLGESIFTSTSYQVGRPINFWADHLQRLALGADLLLGVGGQQWEKALEDLAENLEVLAQNGKLGGNYYLRVTGLSTSVERGLGPSRPGEMVWLCAAEERPERPAGAESPQGRVLQVAQDQRGPMPIKWGNYGPTIMATRQLPANVQDLLFVDKTGEIRECATSNFFAIFPGGEIWTPPVGPGVFAGIYRKNLIAWYRQKGYQMVERSFTLRDLTAAVGAFGTNCVQGIWPVRVVLDPLTGRQQVFGEEITNQLRAEVSKSTGVAPP